MPHTEYEVTVFAKRDISAQAGPYGAFALVGNVEGYGPGGYTGDFVEVMDLGVGSSGWTAYTARFKSSEESFEVILGLGAEAVGNVTFDAVLVRDLTTRRYEYIYAGGSRLAKIEYEGTVPEGQLYYDHYDIIGSPVMLTDFDGAVVWQGDYAPFGESLEAQPVSWGNPYTYMGNEDDGGLMDFGARWYDASIGRFYSADPIKNIASANVVNPYAYCANNPLRYTDKNGLSMIPAATETCDIPRVGGGGSPGGGDPETYTDYNPASGEWYDYNTIPWGQTAGHGYWIGTGGATLFITDQDFINNGGGSSEYNQQMQRIRADAGSDQVDFVAFYSINEAQDDITFRSEVGERNGQYAITPEGAENIRARIYDRNLYEWKSQMDSTVGQLPYIQAGGKYSRVVYSAHSNENGSGSYPGGIRASDITSYFSRWVTENCKWHFNGCGLTDLGLRNTITVPKYGKYWAHPGTGASPDIRVGLSWLRSQNHPYRYFLQFEDRNAY